MKLTKLIIHNIASIEDAEICFDAHPLSDSEVFLITGKTGAGKSTILDAICLALYANTPRMSNTANKSNEIADNDNTIKINDLRQLMRRNTNQAFAELSFVGNDDIQYVARWEIRRTRNGGLKKADWTLKNMSDATIIERVKDIQDKIKQIVGLDFKQFCRTTMLAQGEFTKFLFSNDTEKAEILEKITGVDIYSQVGARIYELYKQKKEEYESAKLQIDAIELLNDEQIEQKKSQQSEIEKQIIDKNLQQDTIHQHVVWLTEKDKLSARAKTLSAEYQSAYQQTQTSEFTESNALITEWHNTVEAQHAIKEQNNALQQIEQQKNIISNKQNEYQQLLSSQQLISNTLEKLNQDIRSYDQQLAAIQLQNQQDYHQHISSRDTQVLQQLADNLSGTINLLTDAQQKIIIYNNEYVRHKNIATRLQQLKESIDNQALQLEQQKSNVLLAEQEYHKRKNEYETQKLTVDQWAKKMRQRLTIGDQCPVCLQQISTSLPHEDNLSQLYQQAETLFTQAEKTYSTLNQEYNRAAAQYQTDSNRYQTEKQTFDTDQTLSKATADAQKALQQISLSLPEDEQLEQTSTLISQLKQAYENAKQLLDKKIRTIGSAERGQQMADTLNNTLEQIRVLLPDWATLQAIPTNMELRQADTIANNLFSDLKASIALLETAQNQYQHYNQQVQTCLSNNSNLTIARLQQLCAYTNADIERISHFQKDITDKVQTLKTNIEQNNEALAEHDKHKPQLAENDTIDTLNSRLSELRKEIAELAQNSGAIKQQLADNQRKREQLEALINRLSSLKNEYYLWDKLNSLVGDLKGDKFRRIAQSYVLQNLIRAANGYLSQLTDRYMLHVDAGTFVISVEDAYQGYARRAATTISGGESFLVSLSLALALSDIGQRLSVDTLFIDEGFGTLSGEPMQNAIQTLRLLHSKTGRHVGIISHIEELKERIPTQIQVTQEGNSSSSTIKVV